MNSRQTKTLAAIFSDPIASAVKWAAVESLLVAVGCKVFEATDSAVRFEKNGVVGRFHRPHPGKEAKHYQLRNAREFLDKIGIRP